MNNWFFFILYCFCLYFTLSWFDEIADGILDFLFIIKLSLIIFCTAILWSFYLGSRSYQVTYTFRKEQEVEYYIDFPVIWM